MNKADTANTLIPHLIGRLPDPFAPDETSAKLVLETAKKWAEMLKKAQGGDEGLKMFTLP